MKIDIALDSHLSPSEIAELGLLAEANGIRAVWCANYFDGRDPFINFAELARVSSTIRMGPIALSPYEMHPFRMALSLLTLNEICPGRAQAILGGGGEVIVALDIPAKRMVREVREAIDIVKGATTSRPFTYHGELYHINNYDPKWVQAPPPAVYAAAARPQMLRMSARASDGIMLSDYSPALAREAIDIVHTRLAELGRVAADFRINNFKAWYVYEEAAEARHEARRWIGFRALFRDYLVRPFLGAEEFEIIMQHIPAIYAMGPKDEDSVEGLPDELLDKCVDNLTLCGDLGDLDRIIEHLLELKAEGLTEMTLELKKHQAHGIRLIGEHVIPAVA